ncbi:MAG: hypothetical protein ACOC5T_08205 [Elusimicrobiota bacterium]
MKKIVKKKRKRKIFTDVQPSLKKKEFLLKEKVEPTEKKDKVTQREKSSRYIKKELDKRGFDLIDEYVVLYRSINNKEKKADLLKEMLEYFMPKQGKYTDEQKGMGVDSASQINIMNKIVYEDKEEDL